MSDSLAIRLVSLRGMRNVSARELAAITGIPYSDLLSLESGSRKRPSADVLRRLADCFHTTGEYLLNGDEPSPVALRAGFFRFYDSLAAEERQQLKYAPIQRRVEAVLQFLEHSYPTLYDRGRMAARLGYTPEALADVLQGTAPLQSYLLKLLGTMVGLERDFFVRGDFFGGAVPAEQDLRPDMLAEYYRVVQEAIAAGVTPAALRKAVRILAIRDYEEEQQHEVRRPKL